MHNKKIFIKCEQNTCPVCGSMNLSYDASDDNDFGRDYPWTCEDCGAWGKERYTDAFDDHSDVHTADGEPVEIVEPNTLDPKDVCPVCGGELKYTEKTDNIKYGIRSEWACSQCHATGWAEFSEEYVYEFTGNHQDVRLPGGSEWDGKTIDLPQTPVDVAEKKETPWCAPEDEAEEAEVPSAPVKAADGWYVPVTWEMFGVVRIPFEAAPTLAEAFKQIKDNPNIELPKGHYVDDSFAPSYELEQIEEVRSAYNDNRPDKEVSV